MKYSSFYTPQNHYREYRDKSFERHKRRRKNEQIVTDMAFDYKGGSCCRDCGHTDRRVLHFAHVPERGPQKYEIKKLLALGAWQHRVMEELDKCDVLCSNCLSIRNFEQEQTAHQYLEFTNGL